MSNNTNLIEQWVRASRMMMTLRMGQDSTVQTELRILKLLCMSGTMEQKELTGLLGLHGPIVSQAIEQLADQGLATRSDHLITITEQGREKAQSSTLFSEEALFQALSEEEQQQLSEYLTRLISSLEKRGGDANPIKQWFWGHGFGSGMWHHRARGDMGWGREPFYSAECDRQ